MAVARDASSPGAVAGTYSSGATTCTFTSASFSPPANSLIVFSVPAPQSAIPFVFNLPTNTGTPLTWNQLAVEQIEGDGGVAVFWAYNSAAQSGITCTQVTNLNSGYPMGSGCIDVWTGTAGNFTGAALVQANGNTGAGNVAITTTAAGSQVAGIYFADFSYNYPPSSTDVAEAIWGAAYQNLGLCAYKATPVATAGATYLNFTDTGTPGETFYIVYEILAGAPPGPTVPAGGGVFVEC